MFRNRILYRDWIWLALSLSFFCFAPPPKEIPEELRAEYTLDGTIPVRYRYFNNSYSPTNACVYTKQMIQAEVARARAGRVGCYGNTDKFLYRALSKFPVRAKSVGVLGSTKPRYEGVVLSRGGHPVTIEYNKIISQDSRLEVMTVDEYDANPRLFDVLISISSFEHDGLGRYGDPIDPFGDIKAMEKCKKMLKPNGILFLAVPVGPDCLVWNAHRIYGKIRMPMLLKGWRILGYYGRGKSFEQDVHGRPLNAAGYQPIFVLTPQ